MLSLGGVGLGYDSHDQDEEAALGLETVSAWLRDNLDPLDIWRDAARSWPGLTLAGLPFRPWGMPGKVEPGLFFWPWGAGRWGCAWYLVDDAALADLRVLAYGTSGLSYNALDLVIDDDDNDITTSMYLLPARPLSQFQALGATSQGNGLNLLPLVDARFFWWFKTANVTLTAGTTTWATLISSVATALGVTIATDSIASAYLKPPASFAVAYDSLPLLLDAALASVGHRLVRAFDGTLTTQTASTARTSVDAQKALYDKVSGGEYVLSPV